jgi:hypothetical protein
VHDIESPESLAWAELQRRGSIRPRYLKGLQAEISAELARCLDPVIHEQDIRPYGAIVTREVPHLERLGRIVDTTGLKGDVIASLADGRHSLVLITSLRGLVAHMHVHLLPLSVEAERSWRVQSGWENGHLHQFLGDQDRASSIRNLQERIDRRWTEDEQRAAHTALLIDRVGKLRTRLERRA